MLDHLKKEQIQGFGAQEKARLSLLVAVLLVLAAAIFGSQSCESTRAPLDEEPTPLDPEGQGANTLDPQALRPRLVSAVFRDEREETSRFVEAAIDFLRLEVRGVPTGQITTRLDVAAFQQLDPREHLGDIIEVQGTVVDIVPFTYLNERNRLWVLVLEDDEGRPFLAVKHALTSDPGGGRPVDALQRRGPSPLVEEGREIVVRGVYIQRRKGTLGEIALREPAPVLYGLAYRLTVPMDERPPAPASLADIPFDDVRDWTSREAEQLQSVDQLHQVIAWARARGYEQIRKDLQDGSLPIQVWDQERFSVWQKEVLAKERKLRPNTRAWRGQVFSTPGLIADINREGWSVMPANKWGVDSIYLFDLYSDHYAHKVIRNVLAFPPETYKEFSQKKSDHVRIYGVFLKNYQYRTKQLREGERPSSNRNRLAVPLFVVLDFESLENVGGVSESHRRLMWIVAGIIVLLGLIFYFVLIRGEGKQAKQFEASRIERRKRLRARREASKPPGDGGDSTGS